MTANTQHNARPTYLAWVGAGVAMLLIVAGVAGLSRAIQRSRLPGEPVSAVLPNATLLNLDGEPLSLAEVGAKPAMINFWATWCPPCVEEMPALETLHREQGDRVTVLAVNVGEDPQLVRAFLTEHGLTLPVLLDSEGQLAAAFDINYLPATLFSHRGGEVVSRHKGALTPEQMETAAQALR